MSYIWVKQCWKFFFFWPKHRNLYMKQEVGHLRTFSILFPISNYTIIDIFSPLLFSSSFISKRLGILYVQAVMRVMCSNLDCFVSFIWLAVIATQTSGDTQLLNNDNEMSTCFISVNGQFHHFLLQSRIIHYQTFFLRFFIIS